MRIHVHPHLDLLDTWVVKHFLSGKHVQVPLKICVQMHPPMLFDWDMDHPLITQQLHRWRSRKNQRSETRLRPQRSRWRMWRMWRMKARLGSAPRNHHGLQSFGRLEDEFKKSPESAMSQHSVAQKMWLNMWLTPKNASGSSHCQFCCSSLILFCCIKMSMRGIGW